MEWWRRDNNHQDWERQRRGGAGGSGGAGKTSHYSQTCRAHRSGTHWERVEAVATTPAKAKYSNSAASRRLIQI